jgi:hydrogenase nickel incorporation protein HypA/HybF
VHELSISEAIAKVVLEHAGGRQVESVQVRVGALRQIVPDALTFCWDVVSRQPQLEGSRLEIEHIDGVIECAECATRSTLNEFVLRCPACGGGLVTVVSGEEFLITSIDLTADDESAAEPVRE